MKTRATLLVLSVAATILFGSNANAQNILNDTILLNTTQNVALVFPDEPKKFDIPKGDGSYVPGNGGKKTLLLQAQKKGAPTQEAFIEEGNRRHRFVLMYTESEVPSKKEWKNTKALKTHVQERAKLAAAKLKEGDALFEKGLYTAAKEKYKATLSDIKEQDKASINNRIADCDKKQQAQIEQVFKTCMEKANVYAGRKLYKEAVAEYKKALEMKPGNPEAKSKEQETRKLGYEAGVGKGDSAMKANPKDYLTAEKEYEEARELDPNRFTKKDAQQLQVAKNGARDVRFAQHKKSGDDAFNIHEWEKARQAYEAALKESEDDNACKQKLKEVLREQREADAKKKDEAVYYAHLLNAKKLAAAKNYDAAIAEYEKAEKIFSQRRFPKDKKEELKRIRNTTARQ